MDILGDPYSSIVRPAIRGRRGGVSAAHPLAVAAGQQMLQAGGSAMDAAIAAQAVICVVMPDAAGLGGDMLALVRTPGEGPVTAVNGTGAAPRALDRADNDGPNSITVPGLVHAWIRSSEQWGRLPLAQCLRPASDLAREGFPVSRDLAAAVQRQGERLRRGGAAAWELMRLQAGAPFRQERLAGLLDRIGEQGASAFYSGDCARSIVAAVQALGGRLDADDLALHQSVVIPALETGWRGASLAVQPPMAQGVLLSMVLRGLERLGDVGSDRLDHVLVELTEAAFGLRARVGEGEALLHQTLQVDLDRARRRGGPRAYFHTAGVATSDADGMVVSSLVSVFDDFGSCVYVPEGAFTLNNRVGGFTDGPNAPGPGKRPVHTLAPAMLTLPDGAVVALATPGADGQVQTLAQVLAAVVIQNKTLGDALHKPRWRSVEERLLVERGHPAAARLQALGHELDEAAPGDVRFGAVVCAGLVGSAPFALADWRRETWAGVA